MEKHLNFEVEDANIIEENPDSQFATAKVLAFSSGESRNDTYCSEEVLQSTAPSIYNKPILYNINNIFDDFNSHIDPSKSLIAGFVVPDSAEFVRLPDNRLSLSVLIKLWKRYSPKAMEIFKRDGGKKKVSVEVDLIDSEEQPNGFLNMKNFVYSGICILGDLVTEASPGAQLEMMSFAKENEEYKEAVKMEFGCYDDIDFTVPENVKKNSEKGLALYKEYGRGATSVSLAHARFIAKNGKITADRIKSMKKIFKSEKFKHMTKSPPSDEYITYMLYGGSDGLAWSEEMYAKIDEQDSKQMSYFGKDVTFPYDSLKDANPAIRGIDPPVSLAQANAIARQAEAIGNDDEVNGWAVAISSFKKTHTVKDGKWVKKETEMEDLEKKEEMAVEKPEKEEMAEEPKKEEMAEEKPEEKKEEEKEEMAADSEEEKKEEEQEKKDEPEEEKKEEKMSNDQNLDVAATLTMLANETDAYSNMVKAEYAKEEKDYAKMFEAMCGKMCQMAEETKNLKSFKADIQKEQFDFAVNSTMKDIEEHSTMPQEKRDYLIEKSKEFSLETIDGWRNLAKAEAFNFATKNEDENKELHFSTPWGTKGTKKVSSLWG